MRVKLVAGLGNPGTTYRGTRHNVGFEVLDLLAARHDLRFGAARVEALEARWRAEAETVVVLLKPLTFMNLSGTAVAAFSRYYHVDRPDLLVVCDDVNLPLGRLRARPGGSDGGHNGLRSVAEALGTMEYPRLRLGVGRGDQRRDLAGHVLATFEPGERAEVVEMVERSVDAVEMWVRHGVEETMNRYNG